MEQFLLLCYRRSHELGFEALLTTYMYVTIWQTLWRGKKNTQEPSFRKFLSIAGAFGTPATFRQTTSDFS